MILIQIGRLIRLAAYMICGKTVRFADLESINSEFMRSCLRESGRVRSQALAVLLLVRDSRRGSMTRQSRANVRKQLERSLRESGYSKSEAARIAGATLRNFKPNEQKETS